MTKQQLITQLKTGDLVFFSSKGLGSSIIRLGTFCRWSHVGVVLKLEKYDFLTLWEAVPSGLGSYCLYSQRESQGVQVVALAERINQHQGDVAVRQLQGGELSPGALHKLMSLVDQLQNRSYEQDFWQLARAGWDGPFGENQEDLSSLFCSELVAAAYKSLGLLDDVKPSNEYTPADFSQDVLGDLQQGFFLSPELSLVEREPHVGVLSFGL